VTFRAVVPVVEFGRCLWFLGLFQREEVAMLWTIFVILLVLWLLGVVTSYSLGGFIHVLLVIAVILAVMQLIQGRRAL
jgi:hypothetical protein